MNTNHRNSPFERGVVLLTLDTEQIWGYLDRGGEQRFEQRFPDIVATTRRLLALLCETGVSATWSVVGGLSQRQGDGAADVRMEGIPAEWTRLIRPGDETTAPTWYGRSTIERIRDASVYQEIGLHGGMTHLCWNSPLQPEDVVRAELAAGVRALNDIGVRATSFTFPRNFESCHHLLLEHGLRCYRGLGPSPEETLGRSRTGAAVRLLAEMGRLTPPAVWPREHLPGLWSIPSSLFLYRMSRSRARIAPLAGRVARARKGIRQAARKRGVFHLWLHPENLTESPSAFPVFEQIVEEIARARRAGDVEVLTMTQLADRMTAGRPVADRLPVAMPVA